MLNISLLRFLVFTIVLFATTSYGIFAQVSNEIARLQKRQAQLEETAKKPPEHEKEEETPQDAEPKHRDLWQIIYAENRVGRIVTIAVSCFLIFTLIAVTSGNFICGHNLKRTSKCFSTDQALLIAVILIAAVKRKIKLYVFTNN